MGFLDWVKDIFDGDKPTPNKQQPPPAAKPSGPKPAPYSEEFKARLAVDQERNRAASEARSRQKELAYESSRGAGLGFGIKPEDYQKEIDRLNPIAQYDTSKGYGVVGIWAPMETPSDGVMELLNEQGFTLPEMRKPVGMPESSFESSMDLKPYEYKITNEELGFIRDTFSSARADAAGYRPPSVTPVDQNIPLMKMENTESAALTWDAYNALSNEQKAAIDFNTLLVDAREKDLSKSFYMPAEQQAEYDSTVERLFGKTGGSETVAPNTVRLLADLNMDLVGQDLDEYLSLERAIDVNELPDFKFTPADIKLLGQKVEGGKEPTYADVRAPENLKAIDTKAIQKAQELIKGRLASPDALTYSFETLMNGPTPELKLAGAAPTGFGSTQSDESFRTAYRVLGSRDLSEFGISAGADTLTWLLQDLADQGADEAAQQEFLQYVAGQANLFGLYGSDEDKTMAALAMKRAGLGG